LLVENDVKEETKQEPAPETEDQREKRKFLEVYQRVGKTRQVAFVKTYTEMHQKKKQIEASKGKVSKCMTYVKRAIPILIVLAILFPILKGILYRKMGW
jgi:hypothetical protein